MSCRNPNSDIRKQKKSLSQPARLQADATSHSRSYTNHRPAARAAARLGHRLRVSLSEESGRQIECRVESVNSQAACDACLRASLGVGAGRRRVCLSLQRAAVSTLCPSRPPSIVIYHTFAASSLGTCHLVRFPLVDRSTRCDLFVSIHSQPRTQPSCCLRQPACAATSHRRRRRRQCCGDPAQPPTNAPSSQ